MKALPMNNMKASPTAISQASSRAEAHYRATLQAVSFTLLTFALLLLMMVAANAGTDSPMGDVLCEIVLLVYGNLGKGLASLAVIVVGVGATLGKVTWGLAMTVAVGISVIFNGHVIVGYLGSGVAGCDIDI